MRKRLTPKLLQAVLVLIFAIILYAQASLMNTKLVSYEKMETLLLENGRGTYTYIEVSVPKGEGPFPLVFMAHGFAGTIHSGGAVELGQRLADKGIIAVRCDFNPYVENSLSSMQTNEYPLSQMKQDALMTINYAIDHYNVKEESIGIYGRSYGGRLAMSMANESYGKIDYKAMVLVAPAGDNICFERFMGGKEKYEEMKSEALSEKGYSEKLGVKVYSKWFKEVEEYNPCESAYKFKDKPVLLFYNTLDRVVYPDTSIRCGNSYSNCNMIEVTTEDGHGHEMGIKDSPLKDMIMDEISRFFFSTLVK